MLKITAPFFTGLLMSLLPSLASAHEFHRPPRVAIPIVAAYPPWPPFAYLEPTPYGQAIHWHWDYYAVLPPKPYSIHRRYLRHMQQQFGTAGDSAVPPSPCLPEIGPPLYGSAPPHFEIPTYASVLEAIETEHQTLGTAPIQAEPNPAMETLPAPTPNAAPTGSPL